MRHVGLIEELPDLRESTGLVHRCKTRHTLALDFDDLVKYFFWTNPDRTVGGPIHNHGRQIRLQRCFVEIFVNTALVMLVAHANLNRKWKTENENARNKVRPKSAHSCRANITTSITKGMLVRGRGLEPLHHCWRQDLNLVRLPISPPSLKGASPTGLRWNFSAYLPENQALSMRLHFYCSPLFYCKLGRLS